MTIYRVYARFEPGHPRMAGRGGGAQLFTRGAWRVVDCFATRFHKPVMQVRTEVGVLSLQPREKGTLINPFKVLKAYLASQRKLA